MFSPISQKIFSIKYFEQKINTEVLIILSYTKKQKKKN